MLLDIIAQLGQDRNHNLLDKTVRKSVNILGVQCVGGFVEGKYTTILSERIGKSEPNDYGRQHLLTGRTATSHVHLYLIFGHHHLHRTEAIIGYMSPYTYPVVVRPLRSATLNIRANFDAVDV